MSNNSDYFDAQLRKAADPDAVLHSSFDGHALAAGMDQLAEQFPEWRGHVPHEVALRYNESAAYQEQFGTHVDSCGLCQGLIETLSPPQLLWGRLMDERPSVTQAPDRPVVEAIEALIRALLKLPNEPVPWPTTAFLGGDRLRTLGPEALRRLNAAEHSDDPLEQFGAAMAYFRCNRPEFAYQVLGRGMGQLGVQATIVNRICRAASINDPSSDYLLMLEHEHPKDLLRTIEVTAQQGNHVAALTSIRDLVVGEQASIY